MSTWKSLLSTQILNLGNNSESVSIRLIPLPQDLVSVLQSRSTVFYWSIDLTEEIHRYGPRISVICIHLLQMVWHCRWIFHQWAWNKEEFTNLLSKLLFLCWRNTPGALDQKRTIERLAHKFRQVQRDLLFSRISCCIECQGCLSRVNHHHWLLWSEVPPVRDKVLHIRLHIYFTISPHLCCSVGIEFNGQKSLFLLLHSFNLQA